MTGPDGLNVAEAPFAGEVKVTAPPSTGSPGLFGVTLTSSAVGNTVLGGIDWLLPATMASLNPDDSNAPMSTAALHPRHAALVGGQGVAFTVDSQRSCHRHRRWAAGQ